MCEICANEYREVLTANAFLLPADIEKAIPTNRKAYAIAIRQELFERETTELSQQLLSGNITIETWQKEMKIKLKELYISGAATGKGGWNELSPRDFGRMGTPLKEQYKYLARYAKYISENRDTVSLRYMQNRNALYSQVMAIAAIEAEAGFYFKDNLPYLPKDGKSECLNRCHCRWVLEITGTEGLFSIVKCVWKVSKVEHCKTCISRNNYSLILKVPIDVEVPLQIGGY